MGVAIVVSVALVGQMAAPGRRGRSIGYYGLALSAPGIVVPSVGVSLLDAGHVEADALIAFFIGLAGAFLVFRLPGRFEPTMEASSNLLAALRAPGVLALYLGFVLVSCSFGAVITYAPVSLPVGGLGSAAVFLFAAGVARAISRWLAGVLGDRRPVRLVLLGSIVVTLVGLIALATRTNPLVTIFAALAFGAGYGAVQTAVYLAMSARGSSSHLNTTSALWNSGIDLGASLGGVLLGVVAARYGYAAAIWAIPAVVLIALPLVLLPARAVPTSGTAAPAEPLAGPAGAIGP
jgi:predicted MFS family arabinose efflux permease